MYTVLKEWSSSGLACMVIQTEMGSLCGYVGVESQYPWFEKDDGQCLDGCEKVPHEPNRFGNQSEEEAIKWADMMNRLNGGHWPCIYSETNHTTIEDIIKVHGGVTFSGFYEEEGGKDIWWIGFDCAHSGDYVPGIAKTLLEVGITDHLLNNNDTFKDEEYVVKEVEQMAKQVKDYG